LIFVGSRDGETEVLLVLPLEQKTENSTFYEAAFEKPVFERSNDHNFVNPYANPAYYWEKCYPLLFPYGRGGPSDRGNAFDGISSFAQHVLKRGGTKSGRRFQQCPSFYYAAYVFDARRRIGGVTYVASQYGGETDNSPMRVDDVKQIIAYVNDSVAVSMVSTTSPPAQLKLTPSVKRLLQKLVPYSKDLPGLPTHFAWERKKLLSMLTSNVVLRSLPL